MNKVAVLLLVVLTLGCGSKESNKVSIRLKWAYQAQFAGYLVAEKRIL